MTEQRTHLDETPARQAQSGTGMRWVLRISLALVVLAFAVIWAIYAGPLSGRRGGEARAPASVAQSVTTTPNSVKEAAATAPPGSVPAQEVGREERSTGGG